MTDYRKIVERLIEKANKAGADEVDVLFGNSTTKEVVVKNQAIRDVVSDTSSGMSMRFFKDKREAVVNISNFDDETLDRAVAKALAMAKVLPLDKNVGLLPRSFEYKATQEEIESLDSLDTNECSESDLRNMACEMEAEAIAQDGITDTDSVRTWHNRTSQIHMTSNGLYYADEGSCYGLEIEALAGEGDDRKTFHDGYAKSHLNDLGKPKLFANKVARTANSMLNPITPKSGKMPVILSSHTSATLLDAFSSAINGYAISAGDSFLKNHLGKKIMADDINIIDDPRMKRSMFSSIVDGDGLATSETKLVEDGVLTQWMMDLYISRKLGLQPNGFGSRSFNGGGLGSSNLYIQPGKMTYDEMLAEVNNGILIHSLMGFGVKRETGDISFGANGWLIENGEVTKAVSGFTIAGNLLDIFATMKVSDEIEFKRANNAPHILIPEIMIGGE